MAAIKIHTLRARINRKLAQQGAKLYAQHWTRGVPGYYSVWSATGEKLHTCTAAGLLAYAHELGVMKPWERGMTLDLEQYTASTPPVPPSSHTSDETASREEAGTMVPAGGTEDAQDGAADFPEGWDDGCPTA